MNEARFGKRVRNVEKIVVEGGRVQHRPVKTGSVWKIKRNLEKKEVERMRVRAECVY